MPRLLLIDDDIELCELLGELLALEGFDIDSAHDGPSGLDKAQSDQYDLILLDVMLPGISGFEVLRQLRQSTTVPVLMLTARGQDIDRVVGLEIGADDYLPKPYNDRELVARIRAILRRTSPSLQPVSVLRCGDLEINPDRLEARCQGEVLELTSAEFNLLRVLADQAGNTVSKEDLSQEVLGRRLGPFDRSIDVHVSHLRRKLPPSEDGSVRIKTVRGRGYQLICQD